MTSFFKSFYAKISAIFLALVLVLAVAVSWLSIRAAQDFEVAGQLVLGLEQTVHQFAETCLLFGRCQQPEEAQTRCIAKRFKTLLDRNF